MTSNQNEQAVYPRARKPWASVELERLRLLYPYEYTREELVSFFGRPPANLSATIREFKAVIKSWDAAPKEAIMFRPALPAFGTYDFNAKFEDLFPILAATIKVA